MIPEIHRTRLFRQARSSYMNSLAPGTSANRLSQARIFLSFMLEYGLDYRDPSPVDVLMYVQLLKNSGRTMGTIKNYLSGAKLYLMERGFSGASFSHHMVVTFLKGVDRVSTHVVTQAVPVPTNYIINACVLLRSLSPEGEIIAASILFAFATMVRQCHLFYTAHGHGHLIPRGDVEIRHGCLHVYVRSSKTTNARNVSVIQVYTVSDPKACPVLAYRRALHLCPGGPHDVLFKDPRTGLAFNAARANLMFKSALAAAGFKGASGASFHSLRRSSAQLCAQSGVPLDQVQRHGMWRSSGIRSYVSNNPSSATAKVISDTMSSNI